MSAYLLTPLAATDILNIWTYISGNSEIAADKIVQAIGEACTFLAEGPLRGHTRPDLTARPLRFWTLSRYPNYTIVYRPESNPLQIVAVMHGKRNIRCVLWQRP